MTGTVNGEILWLAAAPKAETFDELKSNDIAAIIEQNADYDENGLYNASQLAEKIYRAFREYAHSEAPKVEQDELLKEFDVATYQITETVTVTSTGEETFAELRASVALSLPDGFECVGGLNLIRSGDPIPARRGDTYDFDRHAHVAFVRRNPAKHKGPQS